MLKSIHYFYWFAGLHAFLMGLTPFFLPVLLWEQSQSISLISTLISVSGLAYFCTLWVWERIRISERPLWIIRFAFIMQSLLVLYIAENYANLSVLPLGMLNGIYGCFYWMSLRLLFKSLSRNHNSGRHFGNFQILVAVLLKAGIIAGAYLLSKQGIQLILLSSLGISLIGLLQTRRSVPAAQISTALQAEPVNLLKLFSFRDHLYSRPVFFLDGLFLFLESYFWTLSLFILNQQNLMNLGWMIVTLGAVIAVVFWLLKRVIDHIDATLVFRISTILYTLSWLLRANLSPEDSLTIHYLMIIIIAFFTSLFRLSFNKLFFDQADRTVTYPYLVVKSYFSQLGAMIFFGLIAIASMGNTDFQFTLDATYWLAAILAPVFLLYGGRKGI
ncbi:MFS transporter [uncultured Endozoicomonas sp.]|uniref:MFS transporter n=1 Tax=uncultured Endozoicomonas sp. TaxID=432652 RepID=UPI00261139C5|nr:MFS transporter [uncultured Endozoicomonas sp.]